MLVGQVDDRIGRLSAGAEAVQIVEVAAMDQRPLGLECGGGCIGASQAEDLVAAGQQLVDSCGADPAGGSSDEYAQEQISFGLTERTFFRHFADKREVLFDGQDLLQQAFVDAVAEALRARGVPDPAATLAAGSGITVFEVAFLQWISPGEDGSLADLEREVLEQLRAVTG